MSFKTILVSLNEVDRNSIVLSFATRVAALFDAHLTGLYVIPAAKVNPTAAFEPVPAMFEAERSYFEEQAAAAKASFEKAVNVENIRSGFRLFESSSPLVSDLTIEHGREADLVIISQTDRKAASGVELDFVERAAIAMGRPVVVLPRSGLAELLLDTIVIGWNGSREAARAAFDGLPFLRSAKDVRIVWVDPQKEFLESGVLPGVELAETLSRHGVRAVVEPLPSGGAAAGEALLRKASDLGAGLLVVGAYGHARLREFILGGPTRSIIDGMKCPVLLSH